MDQKRVAIACQGGGSQCAFVAGALQTLLAHDIHHQFKIVGLSGTSGGALTAALAWYGLLKEARGDRTPIEDRILACWNDLTAQTPQEIAFDRMGVSLLRMIERGLLPSFASSPSALPFRFWTQALGYMFGRPEFTDLRALLHKHIDFEALPTLLTPDSPVLLVGACDVLDGNFKVFSSDHDEIRVEALLASAAIPNLFPAVTVDGHAYWDGIFSSNPPLVAFLGKAWMGAHDMPDEIWVIQVNRSHYTYVPDSPDEIFDRRNQLAGNLSLRHELQLIQLVNMLLEEGALHDRYRARLGLDATGTIQVRFIRMSKAVYERLDYPSKLSRQPTLIRDLLRDGEMQAQAFLESLSVAERRTELDIGAVSAELH